MATLRAAPTQPGTPWCLKKEGPVSKGEMEPPTPTTPSTKRSSCIEKQAHLPNERQLTVRATPKNCSVSPEQFGAKLDRNGEGAVDDQRQGHMMSRQLTREARKSFRRRANIKLVCIASPTSKSLNQVVRNAERCELLPWLPQCGSCGWKLCIAGFFKMIFPMTHSTCLASCWAPGIMSKLNVQSNQIYNISYLSLGITLVC